MGKQPKVSDRTKPWFQQCQKLKRPYGTRPQRDRYLIVCEGEETEPNYFIALQASLPPHLVDISVVGVGANTFTVVERAVELRDTESQKGYPYDHVWVLFDLDSFPADNFDNAIASAVANDMSAGWSNEAFEIWYLLHFEERVSAMSRRKFKTVLSRYLNTRYEKNSTAMYALLQEHGDEQSAIRRAERLQQEHVGKPPSRSNPCTYVGGLVSSLNTYRLLNQ